MKTVRVRKTPNRLTPNRQAKTPAISLCLHDNQAGQSLEIMDLTPAEWEAIQIKACNPGSSLAHILDQAICRITRDIPDSQLELAKIETCALLRLLADKLDSISRGECGFSGPDAKALVAGIEIMVRAAQRNLNTAFDEVFHALYSPSQQSVGGAQ